MKNAASIFGRAARRKITGPGVDWVLPDQFIGLEIEVETADSVLPDSENYASYWSQKRDGSLRNGVEYVLSTPMKGEQLAQAVAAIFSSGSLARSTTGSTHIHVDMMEESTSGEHIKVLTMLLYALESAVFAVADKGREFCGYTNKLCTAPDHLLSAVLTATEESDYDSLRRISNDTMGEVGRYYGLNLMALAKFCTVEFRYFPTCTSAEELISWIQLVMSFKKAATEIGDCNKLYEIFNNEDTYEQFLVKYFSPWIAAFREEAPQYTSVVMLKKAIAVAGGRHLRGGNKADKFDVRAVMKNKNLSKFVKNKPRKPPTASPLPLMYAVSPVPASAADGQIMVYGNSVYVWTGEWNNWANVDSRNTNALLIGQASITAALPNLFAWLAAQGVTYGPTVSVINVNMRRMLEEINGILSNSPAAGFNAITKDIEYTGLEALIEEQEGEESSPPAEPPAEQPSPRSRSGRAVTTTIPAERIEDVMLSVQDHTSDYMTWTTIRNDTLSRRANP